jgi:hypothetical protein
MQPKAMDDMLAALATVYPQGVVSIVRFIAEQPDALPTYHVHRAIRLYEDWRKKSGIDLGIRLGDKEMGSFPRWIIIYTALRHWETHFTPMMLTSLPDLAVSFVLEHLQSDDEKAATVLRQLRGLTTYSEPLLDRMLAVPALAALIPEIFASCFDAVPAAALRRCLASSQINQEMLLFRLSATSNPLHRSVHVELIQRALASPLNLHHFRCIASMLRGHSRHDALSLLEDAPRSDENAWIWLVREVEAARGERLINEAGHLLR